MKKIEISVCPYRSGGKTTKLNIDGIDVVSNESRLTAFVVRKGMFEWLYPYHRGFQKWQGILPEFVRALNDDTFDIVFCGRERDYQFFCEAIAGQQESLARRGTETEIVQRFAPQNVPAGLVSNVQNVLKDFIDTVVQRLDGDGYEELKKLRDKVSAFPVSLYELSGMADALPDLLAEQGAAQSSRGIRLLVLDGAKALRDLLEDLRKPLEKAQGDENPFVVICLLGESSEQNQKKCGMLLEQLDIRLRSGAVCTVAADAAQCVDIVCEYRDALYLPFTVGGVIESMAQTAERLKNRYEDAYIIQLCNDIGDMQDSMA